MNLLTKLSASAFVLISVLSITSCSPNTPAQKGYEKAKAYLKENIKVPNSLKINGATCYYVVVEEYIVGGGYPYQYKIFFSAKNSFDMTVNDVVYYGYNSEYDSLKSYESDSTKYNSASSGGKKQDIKI
jgi:hypothetical protein